MDTYIQTEWKLAHPMRDAKAHVSTKIHETSLLFFLDTSIALEFCIITSDHQKYGKRKWLKLFHDASIC